MYYTINGNEVLILVDALNAANGAGLNVRQTNEQPQMKGNYMGKDKLSIFLSLVLRHQPEAAGIKLDDHGWANVDELINGIRNTGRNINVEILEEIVITDNKQRYSFNEDKTLIRANHGHSVSVDVELKETQPPEFLYHGTADRFLASIMIEGLKPMSRLYVHLSADVETAEKVGKRHGRPVILKVNSGAMYKDGIKFYRSENGVWLVRNVNPEYLDIQG